MLQPTADSERRTSSDPPCGDQPRRPGAKHIGALSDWGMGSRSDPAIIHAYLQGKIKELRYQVSMSKRAAEWVEFSLRNSP
jgi:hypothetical protein